MYIFNRRFRYLSQLIFLVFLTSLKSNDEDFSDKIVSKLVDFYAAFPQEKAFLHLDKSFYTAGDTLWFKAYLLEGTSHIADSVSQLLYVDLIEESTGKNLALKRIRLEGGTGHGNFVLPDSISNNTFTIRAYTNWMRNFQDSFFYHKSIHLVNQTKQVAPAAVQALDVQFFPEGGQLLNGTNCRVAFKATGSGGLGQDIDGFILNQHNDTVTSFKSEHLGIGRFQITPSRENQYRIYVASKNRSFQRYPFPEIYAESYALFVDNTSSAETMRIFIYHNFTDGHEKQVSLIAHSRGAVAFSAQKRIPGKGLMINVPKINLHDGILHFTLFDDKQRPVCERLVYIDHGRKLMVAIKPDKANYKAREKVKVEVTITDSDGMPVESNFSVAVTDAGQVSSPLYSENAESWLNLISDLKGFIEQPSYYFDSSQPLRKIHMDYLMMSQGWSRFRWQDVLLDSVQSPAFDIEQGVTLRGQVIQDKKTTNEKIAFSIFLESPQGKTVLMPVTDKNGAFKVSNLVFTDSANVRLQGTGKKSIQNFSFIIQPFEAPKASQEKWPGSLAGIDPDELTKLFKHPDESYPLQGNLKNGREKQLQEVTIRSKKSWGKESGKLYSSADVTLNVTPQMASFSMSVMDLIKGKVAGVEVTGIGPTASVSIRGSFGEPLFLLDGLPGGKELVNSVNVNDVGYIDVLKGASAAIYGSRAGNGVIAVYTKKANDSSQASSAATRGILHTKLAGFDNSREFYSPKYQVDDPNHLTDYRSTVYWAPMLKTGKDGKAIFEYYNGDARNKLVINLEAISPSGLPGYAKADYLVQ